MELSYPNLDIAPEKIIFAKVDMSGPLLRRDSLWFKSCKRPLSIRILGGRLREVRLYYN